MYICLKNNNIKNKEIKLQLRNSGLIFILLRCSVTFMQTMDGFSSLLKHKKLIPQQTNNQKWQEHFETKTYIKCSNSKSNKDILINIAGSYALILTRNTISIKECFAGLEDRTRPRPSEYQADAHSTELPSPVLSVAYASWDGIIQFACFAKWPHRDFIQRCFRDSDEVADLLRFCKILIFYVSCDRSTLNESYNCPVYILKAKLCRAQFRSFESDL